GDRRATSAAARDAIAAALATLQEKVGKPSAESLAELQKHAYPATELGAGGAGEAAADEPVPGREG
ncbi:1-acyl-sn-glycerol-3-phosphate acyltransferase, partial [Escherichia coli]